MKYFRRALHYLRPYSRWATVSVCITVLTAVISLVGPWPMKILIDHVIQQHPAPPLLEAVIGPWMDNRVTLMLVTLGISLALVLLTSVFSVVQNYLDTRLSQYMVLDFRSALLQQAQRLSLAYHDQRRSGDLIYAINNQADAPAALVMTIPVLVQSALMLVGMFWISLTIDWQLALLSLVIVPFLYASVGYYTSRIQKRLRGVMGMESESLQIVHEAISMQRVIVAFGREKHEHQKFREQGERAVDARVNLTVRQTLFSLVVNLITACGTTLVLGFGVYHAVQGKLTIGQLMVMMAYLAAVYRPLQAISYTIGSLQDRIVALQMTCELLDAAPEIQDSPNAIALPTVRGDVRYENVSFSYGGRTGTLKDITFEAKPGQVVAIVGPTGAGKTTLISVLPRFYDPSGGRITLAGHDIRDLTLSSLRGQISIVMQEPLLFTGTIFDNIRYGRLDATEADIIAAAKAANAHEFIERLPQKYQTVLGERGAAVSGGERQRISIARAFVKNAPILILDEPTSAVDSKTETVILEALERLMVGRTTFMIAHRLSTVRNADLILVMNQGQIVERGTQEELLQLDGLYKQLYDTQTAQSSNRPQPEVV